MTNEIANELLDSEQDRVAGPRTFTNMTHNHTGGRRQYYDGADLKPYDGRPGALDFLSKPSRGLS